MESTSSENEGSLRDNDVDLNSENMEHNMAMEVGSHFNGSEIILPTHQEASENIEPFIGMEFESEETAKESYMSYASRVGFSVRISKSRRSRNDESIIMRRFVCSKEGFHMKKGNYEDGKKKRKRATIREGCNAMIEVIQKYYGRWVVTKLVKEHNHVVAAPSRVRYVAPEEYADMEPFVGMEFSSHEAAQMFYYAYATRVGFDVRIRLSRRSTRDESFVMRRFVCTKEGFTPFEESFDDSKKKRNRTPTREGCKAMFEVIKKDSDRWIVSKLITEHTHDLVIAPGKVHYIQSQSEVVVLAKSSAVNRENSKPQLGDKFGGFDSVSSSEPGSRNDIKDACRNAFGFEETQFLLESLKKMQAESPAFFYAFQVDKNNHPFNVFWADAKAKMAYYCFGDAVTVDISYKENENMIPFVLFAGINHHCQSVAFGCALLIDETEASFIWLFENWLLAMCGRPPISLITDHHEAMAAAISTVFPDARHKITLSHILQKCSERLPNLYFTCNGSETTTFKTEFLQCIDESETVQVFERRWKSIVDKYELGENSWLQFLHSIRHKWVPAYHRDTFTADISLTEKPESLSMFFEKYFNKKTSLQIFIGILDQAMAVWCEREALEDFASSCTRPLLKTPSGILRQAAEIYTRTVFDAFQDEFVESLGYFADKFEDGMVSKYKVAKDEDSCTFIVSHDSSDKRTSCSCFKFERSGILCRHILRVFLMVDVRVLPEQYILKRWTKDAKNGFVLDECARYSELACHVIRYAKEGSTSPEAFNVAKHALQMAFAEVLAAKKDIASRCAL